MPGLLTLKTDLKSLKYGQDQPGGGDSGQPYIKTDINTVDSGFNRLRLTKFDDGLVRGGIVGAINASVTDTLRIGKFLVDPPKGPLFIVKQIGLQLSNPRVETSTLPTNKPISGQGFINNAINFVSNVANKIENAVGPTRIYNLGINTLAQVPVNAIGGHIVRHGFLPNNDDSKYYYNVVTKKNFQNDTNRLIDLTDKFSLGSIGIENNGINKKEKVFLDKLSVLANSGIIPSFIPTAFTNVLSNNIETNIDSYLGGPNSVYGIGSTTIRRAMDSDTSNPSKKNGVNLENIGSTNNKLAIDDLNSNLFRDTVPDGPSSYPNIPIPQIPDNVYGNAKTYTAIQSKIVQQSSYTQKSAEYISGSVNKDIYVNQFGIYNTERGDPANINKNNNYSTTDVGTIGYQNSYGEVFTIKGFTKWSDVSRENRVGSFGKAKYNGKELRAADSINLTPIFTGSSYWSQDSVSIPGEGDFNIRDLVKFRIQAVDTDKPDEGSWMVFRAYLTSFSDSVDADWKDVKYAGRGDRFYIYDGFTRKMQIGFKVAALSAAEMKPMYQKLNYLMSNLMPDYRNNLMRGPLIRMTVGNYIDCQLGKLDSLSYTIPNDSPWEIALDEPEGGTKQLILPHILEVSMTFTPIGAETGLGANNFSVKYGAQSGSVHNEIPQKAQNFSNIAQNTTGDVAILQYIE